MAIGLAQPGISPEVNRPEKEKTCELARRFMLEFEERNGSTLCSELLGCDISTPEGRAKARQEGLPQSRCPKLVRDAVDVVLGMLADSRGSGLESAK
jgi:hypothetical protein